MSEKESSANLVGVKWWSGACSGLCVGLGGPTRRKIAANIDTVINPFDKGKKGAMESIKRKGMKTRRLIRMNRKSGSAAAKILNNGYREFGEFVCWWARLPGRSRPRRMVTDQMREQMPEQMPKQTDARACRTSDAPDGARANSNWLVEFEGRTGE